MDFNISDSLGSFLSSFTSSLPGVIGALAVLIIGWIVAKFISKLIYKVLKGTGWDQKLMGSNGGKMDVNSFISKIVYYLLMIMVLMIVLNMMGVSEVLDPLKAMVNQFFSYVPNIIGAGIIGFIGYILATFASEAIGMGGSFIDGVATKMNFNDTEKLTNIIKNLVFAFIILLFAITALDVLDIQAISGPAKKVLGSIFDALPKLFAAGIIIAIFMWGAKFISEMLYDVFRSSGVDELANKLDLGQVIGKNNTMSGVLSKLVYFFIAFFGVTTGIEQLGFESLNGMMNTLLGMSGQIIFGLIILIAGNFISKLAATAVSKGGNEFLGTIVRVATLFIFIAMAFGKMGIDGGLMNTVIGLVFGAAAVAIALAYGLGGREAAGEHMKEIIGKIK